MLEFAVIAPIIFLFLFGIIDFGMMLDRRITLQHAVREGARYGAVTADIAAVRQRTAEQAQGMVEAADVEVCFEDGPDTDSSVGDPGDIVRVRAPFTYDLAIVGPLIGLGSIDISPSGAARLELMVPDAVECGP